MKLEKLVLICHEKRAVVVRVLLAVLLAMSQCLTVNAAESGVNELTEIDGTAISTVSHDPFVSNSEPFSISITVNGSSNVTSVLWISQACINSGVCYPPQTHEMVNESANPVNTDSNHLFFATRDFDVDGQFESLDDHVSYLNWKFVLVSEDGYETNVPESGFGWKLWSNCWYDNSTWGGNSSHCHEEGPIEETPMIPNVAAPLTIASIAMAALMSRRV